MLFNSIEFLFAFFPITFFGYVLLQKRSSALALSWLTLASFFFYGWWDVLSLPILLVSISVNYWIGLNIGRAKGSNHQFAAMLLRIGVIANLAALGYYKYSFFVVSQLQEVGALRQFTFNHVELPIGISFFTFTQIAYLMDVYKTDIKEYNPIHYSLFVSYFPHLIAGPILHHKEMMPQFQGVNSSRIDGALIAEGLGIFGIGLAKKLLLADPLGIYANKFFNGVAVGHIPGIFESAFGTLAYTFQLYFDFSGYSDMAVGISLVFGIRLPINFSSPYRSASIIEFWRRWHMTLSRFLRDYLYFSLGGNRKGRFRRYLNLLTTMVLGGLWHGAGWTFLLWGFLHGMYLVINHAWNHLSREGGPLSVLSRAVRPLGGAVTFIAVALAWIPFRAASLGDAQKIGEGLLGFNGTYLPSQVLSMVPFLNYFVGSKGTVPLLADGTIMGFAELCVLLLMAGGIAFFCKNTYELSHRSRIMLAGLALPLLLQKVFFGGSVEFLYFQF